MKNKGFTLMELIVAMAVGSIVLLMVSVMLVRGTSLFRTENNEVNTRNDYQIVRNQIDQAIMEAKGLIIEHQDSGEGVDIIIYTGEINKATRDFTTPAADRTTERVIYFDKSENSIHIKGSYSEANSEGNRVCDIVSDFTIAVDEGGRRQEIDSTGATVIYYVNPIRVNITLSLVQKQSFMNSSFAVNLRNRLKSISLYATASPMQLLNAATSSEEYKVK